MKDSQSIVFVDTLVDKFSDKEAKKSQSDIQIGWWASKCSFKKNIKKCRMHFFGKLCEYSASKKYTTTSVSETDTKLK